MEIMPSETYKMTPAIVEEYLILAKKYKVSKLTVESLSVELSPYAFQDELAPTEQKMTDEELLYYSSL